MRPALLLLCASVLVLTGAVALTLGGEAAPEEPDRVETRAGVRSPVASSRPAPTTPSTRRADLPPAGLTGDDLPELPPEMEHLAELDLVEALSDPELPREVLRAELALDARAELLHQLALDGRSAEEIATWTELLEEAEAARSSAEDRSGAR